MTTISKDQEKEERIEEHSFQAEVTQLLDIVVHSLYTNKEIFVRELVSNASDALEKLRHVQLVEKEIFDDKLELEINLTTDEMAGTITFQDFGVGMNRAELVENLGTIAHSGSKAFLQALKEGPESTSELIGQFGVGFYSAFMVAEEVKVYTRSWQKEGEHLVWTSDGTGNYQIETVEGQRRGCKVVMRLKEEEKDFSKEAAVKDILTRYSSFVQFPINLNGERVNKIQALWLRNKNEIKEEEYTEFYKFQANAFDEPSTRMHFSADAPLAINALLFVPKTNMEKMGFMRLEPGVSLYCRKVLIDAKPEGLLPEWLRFLRGVVDSADLPLNISRETMQDSALVQKLNKLLTRRFLKHLEGIAKKNPDHYLEIYKAQGIFLKEGITSDFSHREQLGKLLRYETSHRGEKEFTSLADYVEGMKEGQKEIYYYFAPNRETIEAGPYLEAFKASNLEVLFLYEPIDEFVMSHLNEYDGKPLVSADQAEVQIENLSQDQSDAEPLTRDEETQLCEWIKKQLEDRVDKVTGSKRLVDSPAIVLNADKMISPTMRRMMKAMQQDVADQPKVNLEIHLSHPLVKNLFTIYEKEGELAGQVVEQIYDTALVAAGYNEDPRGMVNRIYNLLEQVTRRE